MKELQEETQERIKKCVEDLGLDHLYMTLNRTNGYAQFVKNLKLVMDLTQSLGFKSITLNSKSLGAIRYVLERNAALENVILRPRFQPELEFLTGINLIKMDSGIAPGVKELMPINSLYVQIVKAISEDQEDFFLWTIRVVSVNNENF